MQDPVLFTLTVLFILGTPGPTNTLLATAGGTVGFRRALPLVEQARNAIPFPAVDVVAA